MADPIRATVLIDADALAALGTSQPAETAAILADLRKLLAEVRDRLDADARIMVDAAGAEKLTGVCERSLRNHRCPFVRIGSRRLYRIEALKAWAAQRESSDASEPAGVSR
jgi:hypothetical protein